MSHELREQISKYIGFSPEEIRLPITDEDKQLFQKEIADLEKITNMVMEEYQYLQRNGYNYKGGDVIHVLWVGLITRSICEKILVEVPPSDELLRQVLSHL